MGPIPFPRMPANIYNIVDFAPLCVILVVPLLNVAWLVYLARNRSKLAQGVEALILGTHDDWNQWRTRWSRVRLPVHAVSEPIVTAAPAPAPTPNTSAQSTTPSPWILLVGLGLSMVSIVLSSFALNAVPIGKTGKYTCLPFGLSWLITVPTLWVLNTLLIVRIHVFVVKSIRNPDAAPVLAQQLGASALTLGGITGAIPLGTYLLSLPLLHDWCDGWPVDVLVVLVLPLLGLAIAAWGVMLKLRFRETVFPNVQPPELL